MRRFPSASSYLPGNFQSGVLLLLLLIVELLFYPVSADSLLLANQRSPLAFIGPGGGIRDQWQHAFLPQHPWGVTSQSKIFHWRQEKSSIDMLAHYSFPELQNAQ